LSGEGQAVDAVPVDTAGVAPLTVGWGIVRGRYFETLGVRLQAGRLFSIDDRADSPAVAIVDDVLARRLWASESEALGRRVRFGAGSDAQTRTVVGVVRRVSHAGPGQESLPMAYAPQSQAYQRGMYTVIRTTSEPQALMTAARAAVSFVDPAIPMYFAETVDARYDGALALPRFTAGLVSAFSALALILAGVGIFGVTGYAVAQRSREFAIRTALGARRAHVSGLVVGRVALLGAIGVGLGGALGFALSTLMSGILFRRQTGGPDGDADDHGADWPDGTARQRRTDPSRRAREPGRRAAGRVAGATRSGRRLSKADLAGWLANRRSCTFEASGSWYLFEREFQTPARSEIHPPVA
jgi:hypothetical protein